MSNIIISFKRFTGILCLLMIYTAGAISTVRAAPVYMPEPDPPFIILDLPAVPRPAMKPSKAAPTTEWTYHKTSDNLHPDNNEQQMVWLMNRARSNPTQEGIWLATLDDADVLNAVSYFGVDLDLLQDEFAAIDAAPPAAFDVRLYNGAKAHSEDLIARDAQDHTNQFTRVVSAGFTYTGIYGNVYSYTKSAVHGHAGFNIDWGGDDGTGMQTGRGHRIGIMSINANLTNVGIAMVSETNSGTQVGPLVTTGNYANADEGSFNHYNRFLVGTVWEDLNGNAMYDPGEGIDHITITPDQGTYYAVSSNSGGYAIPVNAGDYVVTFSGTGLGGEISRSVTVGTTSVLLDLLYTGSADDPGDSVGGTVIVGGDASGGGGCFIDSAQRSF